MRRSLLIAFLCAALPIALHADLTAADLVTQGQQAYVNGDYTSAKQAFDEAIELDPQNAMAAKFLRMIKMKTAGTSTAAKDPLKALVIPSIQIKDATFAAALDLLKQDAAKQNVAVSIVPQLPAPQMEHKVTLSLTQVPFLDALRYLCTLNSAVYREDPYAIVIMPVPATAPVPPQ